MRPIASTAVASTHSSAAPPSARWPRWIRCQSLAEPSSAEYWHIGETMIRFRSVRPRSWKGEKSALVIGSGRFGGVGGGEYTGQSDADSSARRGGVAPHIAVDPPGKKPL